MDARPRAPARRPAHRSTSCRRRVTVMGALTCMPFDPDVLATGVESALGQQFAKQQRNLATLADIGRCAGIEIEDDQVGARFAASRRNVPLRNVQLQRCEIGQPDQGGELLDDDEVDRLAIHRRAGYGQGHGANPGRRAARRVLLEEERAVDAVGIALDRQRPPGQVRKQHRRHAGVVVDDLAFGEAGLRIEHLVEIRQAKVPAVDLHDDPFSHCGQPLGRRLSGRMPRKTGWRSAAIVGPVRIGRPRRQPRARPRR